MHDPVSVFIMNKINQPIFKGLIMCVFGWDEIIRWKGHQFLQLQSRVEDLSFKGSISIVDHCKGMDEGRSHDVNALMSDNCERVVASS